MRELKGEEYGMISGGTDTTNLGAMNVSFINGPPTLGLDSYGGGGGLSQAQADQGCRDIGRLAKLVKKVSPQTAQAGKICATAVTQVQKFNDATPAAECKIVQNGTWDYMHHVCRL